MIRGVESGHLFEFCPSISHCRKTNTNEEAGKVIADLPMLSAGASKEEKRKLLTMLDAVYVDAKEERSIVTIKPKPPFRPIFQVATIKEGSDILLIKEPPDLSQEAPLYCWWRRGRVELYRTIPYGL